MLNAHSVETLVYLPIKRCFLQLLYTKDKLSASCNKYLKIIRNITMKKLYGGLYFSEGSLDTLVYKLSSLASCFQLKKKREMFWVIVFTVMMLFSIVANCILIWIILGKPIFRRLTIYFKANASSFVF